MESALDRRSERIGSFMAERQGFDLHVSASPIVSITYSGDRQQPCGYKHVNLYSVIQTWTALYKPKITQSGSRLVARATEGRELDGGEKVLESQTSSATVVELVVLIRLSKAS